MGYKARVYYHHTDCGKVVYYANYLQFLEEARTDFLERKGISIKDHIKQGRFFVVSRQEIDYELPAYYADVLDISTEVKGVSGVRIDLEHEIRNGSQELIARARTALAFINTDFRPCAIPESLREKLLKD
ncbi:MAG: acyl-CoA thioesterase [Candidatus Omnitrophica bacterium]|nr:acyl-CoA thioesterase [Candidatus Omnitrophota bacterium]